MDKKIAVITGGVSRLGRDITIELAKSGFFVIPIYNSSVEDELKFLKEKLTDLSSGNEMFKCDLSKIDDISKTFEYIKRKYKTIDLLVNNAALFEHKDFFDIDVVFWERFMNVNLKAVFFCSQLAARMMLNNPSSSCQIINIASLGAYENWTGYIPYSVSKAGVVKLTEQLAKKLAPKILVNAIAPGTIVIEGDENITVNQNEMSKYPMEKFGTSNDITGLIRFLALENKFITGQIIKIDGGRSL